MVDKPVVPEWGTKIDVQDIANHPTTFVVIVSVVALILLWRFRRWTAWSNRIDWRFTAILAATIISIIASLIVYSLGLGRDPSTFFGAVFASWVGGVAFFSVIGAGIAIVSLSDPGSGAFDARARILFRKADGPHVDYIVHRIKDVLEHYAEKTICRVTVLDYHPPSGKIRMALEITTTVRSYIDDIDSTCKSHIEYEEITMAPEGCAPNRLVFVRVDKKPQAIPIDPIADKIYYPLNTAVSRNGTCEISHRLEVWMDPGTESVSHTPARYSQELTLSIENHLPSARSLSVTLSAASGSGREPVRIDPGEAREGVVFNNLRPTSIAYELKFEVLSIAN